MEFIVWPAHEASHKVIVRISTRELSALAGVPFGIDSTKTNTALQNHRDHLKQRANEEPTEGANEVVLDVGRLIPIR